MTATLWLAIRLSAWLYGLDPATLEGIAYRESRYQCDAVRGTHCGCGQVSTRWSRYTCRQLQNPVIGMLEAGRLVAWFEVHYPGRGLRRYRGLR